MKLGIIKTIGKEALAKYEQLPGWLDPFLQILNQFIHNAGTALNGNLDFQNNFKCTVKTIKLTHGVELEVNPYPTTKKLRVGGVACFHTNGLIIDKFGWRYLNNGNIAVTIYYATGTSSDCKLIIFLE